MLTPTLQNARVNGYILRYPSDGGSVSKLGGLVLHVRHPDHNGGRARVGVTSRGAVLGQHLGGKVMLDKVRLGFWLLPGKGGRG